MNCMVISNNFDMSRTNFFWWPVILKSKEVTRLEYLG
jgi:hypothetical protein